MVSKESKFTEQIGALIGGRYRVIKTVGAGTYGAVFECEDIKNQNKSVAVKKLHRLEDKIDGKRVLREIRILRCCEHENILKLKDLIHKPDESGDLGDIYLVTDLFETDLYSILKSKQELTDEHAQYFVYQILRALKYLHSAGIVHRDIKPSNILVNGNCDISLWQEIYSVTLDWLDLWNRNKLIQLNMQLHAFIELLKLCCAVSIIIKLLMYGLSGALQEKCQLKEFYSQDQTTQSKLITLLNAQELLVKKIRNLLQILMLKSILEIWSQSLPKILKLMQVKEKKLILKQLTYQEKCQNLIQQTEQQLTKHCSILTQNNFTIQKMNLLLLTQLTTNLKSNLQFRDPGITYEQLKDLIREEFKYFSIK